MASEQIPKLKKTTDECYIHWCPGCKTLHQIAVGNSHQVRWSFNGDLERPTFNPSVLTFNPSVLIYGWQNVDPNFQGYVQKRCHYFIRDGNIEFCSDSEHELAGQTVPLLEPEY